MQAKKNTEAQKVDQELLSIVFADEPNFLQVDFAVKARS